ncbi:hypothetical protein MIDIC_70020 [Alphaproteobacteria bacterium]
MPNYLIPVKNIGFWLVYQNSNNLFATLFDNQLSAQKTYDITPGMDVLGINKYYSVSSLSSNMFIFYKEGYLESKNEMILVKFNGNNDVVLKNYSSIIPQDKALHSIIAYGVDKLSTTGQKNDASIMISTYGSSSKKKLDCPTQIVKKFSLSDIACADFMGDNPQPGPQPEPKPVYGTHLDVALTIGELVVGLVLLECFN